MPPRLNKRQQRETEELQSLTISGGQTPNEDSDEPPIKPGLVGLAARFLVEEDVVGEGEGDGGESEEGEGGEGLTKPANLKSRTRKKKKKKKTPGADVDIHPLPPPPQPVVKIEKTEKKALKKARAKEKKGGIDELDSALAELSSNYLPAGTNTSYHAHTHTHTHTFAHLLSISAANLDPETELRKFFGSKVVQAHKPKHHSTGPGRSSNPSGGHYRSQLTRPKETWWSPKLREGMSLRGLTEEEVSGKEGRSGWVKGGGEGGGGERWWTVVYSKRYMSVTKAFLQGVMAGDPEAFWDLLSKLPWHADTLLQLAEVYRHREEYAQAVDFVDRALFTYERNFLGTFTFTSGTNRLDFDHVENRPFFLAIHRQITDLQRRGCVRTAFEFAKLLYSLDPWADPHGALLHLDLLALKAGMHEWLLDLYDWFVERRRGGPGKVDGRMDPSVLPGWAYARAFALRMGEDARKGQEHDESTKALKEAIAGFPPVVPLLADKLDLSILVSIRGHRDFRIETDASSLSAPDAVLHLLSHLYVQRSFGIWKDPTYSSWFLQTLAALYPSSLPSSLPKTAQHTTFITLFTHSNPQASAHRHILVLEATCRRLFAFVPRTTLGGLTASSSLACDPLPPATAVSKYDEAFFEGVEDAFTEGARTRREQALDERRLAQLIPDAAFRRQLEGFFEANPAFANQFPRGIVQFAQAAGQMPEGVLEDMMAMHLAEGVVPEQGGMPGQMPGVEFLGEGEEGEGEDEDEDEDEEEYISPMPRVLRNFIGRFWGRVPVEEDSSEED